MSVGCERSQPAAAPAPVTETPTVDAAPALLSAETTRVDVDASEGAGIYGAWATDRYGLPAYDYTLDQINDAHGARADLRDRREAWHQLGNDAIIANAYNHGYTELWSQQRLYQWVNKVDEAAQQYGGGFGYLHADGQTASTLWVDRAADMSRRFGLGYYERATTALGIEVSEAVTTPYGDLPVLVHEVTLRNPGSAAREVSWWEYWGVNPKLQVVTSISRGLLQPAYDESQKTLSVAQLGDGADTAPLTLFLAAADAPVDGYETSLTSFFGDGDRGHPAAVTADAASNSIASPSLSTQASKAVFAMRAPLQLAPGQSVKLRYLYGMAHAEQIADIVQQVKAQPDTQAASSEQWAAYVPQVNLGEARRWFSRELQWDAYMVRSSSLYEEPCGHHVITQGGYYQYGLGLNIAFRDPLQHMLPVIYSDPPLAREVLLYSLQQQAPGISQISYGIGPLCTRMDSLGTANDLDQWLLLSVIEYVMATRDFAFLDEAVGYRGGLPLIPAVSSASVWEHLKLAYFHQETVNLKGPNGHYVIGSGGDWSDLSPIFLQMTESVLVSTQAAYIYPRLAELAERYGDLEFAAQLRSRSEELQQKLDTEWTGGWYSRGYSGTRQIGSGAIFGEPQPWAILAGVPDDAQQYQALFDNTRRFLTGIGAPEVVHGPAKIGSSQSPYLEDPDVDETSFPTVPGSENAVFVGGVWYAVNGWLSWAMAQLDGIVPGAADFALDELERNTLKAHADAYPEEWNGILNVDDSCDAHFSASPHLCGIGVFTLLLNINGQITHQPAWSLFSLLKLAGIEPNGEGYRIRPRLPLDGWSLRMQEVGLAQDGNTLRGYFRPAQSGPLVLSIYPRVPSAAYVARINGQVVPATVQADGSVRVETMADSAQVLDWSLGPL